MHFSALPIFQFQFSIFAVSPMFPLHTRAPSITPFFPLHPQKQGGTPSPKMSARRHFRFFPLFFAVFRPIYRMRRPFERSKSAGIKTSATWKREEGGIKPPLQRQIGRMWSGFGGGLGAWFGH